MVIYEGEDEILICNDSDASTVEKEFFRDGGRNILRYKKRESPPNGVVILTQQKIVCNIYNEQGVNTLVFDSLINKGKELLKRF